MKIAWMSCTSFGVDMLRSVAGKIPINAIIGLRPEAGADVSSYADMEPVARGLGIILEDMPKYNSILSNQQRPRQVNL